MEVQVELTEVPVRRFARLRSAMRVGLDLVAGVALPQLCAACREPVEGVGLCAACWSKLSLIGLPYCGRTVAHQALKRVKATPQQVGLDKSARAQNVQGAFRVPPEGKAEVVGRKLVLVDDVLTSGATVSACARTLLRSGAASVDVVVFARVVTAGRLPI